MICREWQEQSNAENSFCRVLGTTPHGSRQPCPEQQSWLVPDRDKHWIMNVLACTIHSQTQDLQIAQSERSLWQLEQQDVKKGASYRSNYSCLPQIGLFKVKANWNVHKKQEESSCPKCCVPGPCWGGITPPCLRRWSCSTWGSSLEFLLHLGANYLQFRNFPVKTLICWEMLIHWTPNFDSIMIMRKRSYILDGIFGKRWRPSQHSSRLGLRTWGWYFRLDLG